MSKIRIADKEMKTVFCVERTEKGVTRAAAAVARDLRDITGQKPCNIRVAGSSDPENGACANASVVITAGTLGAGGYIDTAAEKGVIDVSLLRGRRECYLIKPVSEEKRTVIYIAGSDLLGTEYGLYHISELAGVSPWHYWGDVLPLAADAVEIEESKLDCVSKEPAIALRGFFMNDEWPSLGGWVHEKFGGFNEFFYDHVFDLLLRLRGNFLWPAMWSAVFSEDGYAYPTACAELANDYGIIMGTSHHEPLFRAGEEFSHTQTFSNDLGYGKDWSYYSNERGLYEFWDYSVKRNRDFASLITVGMRGERDSKILGEDATLADNIELLRKTITDQKKILSENGLENAPKVLALYKEVEDYFYGDENTAGLREWDGLDDVMFLLSDDNFANTRTLPSDENRDRPAGWGLYYHFDYHGDPISYEWVNSTPITKAWEQLTMAYEYGIRGLWVANVGDLRPQELPLSYFMDLAFDYDIWSERNRTGEFLEKWTEQQFCGVCDEKTLRQISAILNGYTRLNGDRRPEATHADTFSLVEEHEAERELARAKQLEMLTDETEKSIPAERLDAFTGLVSFPARASANLRKMMIYAGIYNALNGVGAALAEKYHKLVEECIERDKELVGIYNNVMSDGKWHHMMSSKHVDFVNWNDEGSDYPHTACPVLPEKGKMLVAVSGRDGAVSEGETMLPVFTSVENRTEDIWLLYTGSGSFSPAAEWSAEWIKVRCEQLGFGAARYSVSVDFGKLTSDSETNIVFSCDEQSVSVKVCAHICDTAQIPAGTFIESDGAVSIEAEHFSSVHDADGCGWRVIDNYGKGLSSIKCLPDRRSFTHPESAPYAEYSFFIEHADEYFVTCVLAPTNNTAHGKGLRYALILDGGRAEIIDSLPENFAAGSVNDEEWKKYVLDNCRRSTVKMILSGGLHTLRFCQVDAGIVLQKIEIAKKPSKAFYGLRETARKQR